MKGYWFGDVLQDGTLRKPEVGVTHRLEGPGTSMRAAFRALDALGRDPSTTLWGVELGGTLSYGKTQVVATERTYLWRLDAGPVIDGFVRWCALTVAQRWDMPIDVRRFLESGDPSLRSQALAIADTTWTSVNALAFDALKLVAREGTDPVSDNAWAASDASSAVRSAKNAALWGMPQGGTEDAWNAVVAAQFAKGMFWNTVWAVCAARPTFWTSNAGEEVPSTVGSDFDAVVQAVQFEAMIEQARGGQTKWVWKEENGIVTAVS